MNVPGLVLCPLFQERTICDCRSSKKKNPSYSQPCAFGNFLHSFLCRKGSLLSPCYRFLFLVIVFLCGNFVLLQKSSIASSSNFERGIQVSMEYLRIAHIALYPPKRIGVPRYFKSPISHCLSLSLLYCLMDLHYNSHKLYIIIKLTKPERSIHHETILQGLLYYAGISIPVGGRSSRTRPITVWSTISSPETGRKKLLPLLTRARKSSCMPPWSSTT